MRCSPLYPKSSDLNTIDGGHYIVLPRESNESHDASTLMSRIFIVPDKILQLLIIDRDIEVTMWWVTLAINDYSEEETKLTMRCPCKDNKSPGHSSR